MNLKIGYKVKAKDHIAPVKKDTHGLVIRKTVDHLLIAWEPFSKRLSIDELASLPSNNAVCPTRSVIKTEHVSQTLVLVTD